ncbi:hypothetical protein NC653_002935 [Populus alba x Populus x berolinensis]|uniref:Uncharacterized protein n=1 Tax=Populus alba x Populus x berolinensis TaxID=444605 RepID=A0AAD6WHF8_9ROSI|nr:hypothetical protein NC653_002935 [Populus alba x Populus x berolinensis]
MKAGLISLLHRATHAGSEKVLANAVKKMNAITEAWRCVARALMDVASF